MTRGTFFLLAPVVIAASAIFVFHGGEIERADYFFLQVMGLSVVFWILIALAKRVGVIPGRE